MELQQVSVWSRSVEGFLQGPPRFCTLRADFDDTSAHSIHRAPADFYVDFGGAQRSFSPWGVPPTAWETRGGTISFFVVVVDIILHICGLFGYVCPPPPATLKTGLRS